MASTNTQFSVAVHLMTGLGYHLEGNTTSAQLAKSINTSASFVRRVLSKLVKAGLVHTTTGKAGSCSLARVAKEITLLDIYAAVESPKAFAIHEHPVNKKCIVSAHIKSSLEKVLTKTQRSMEESLRGVSLAQVVSEIKAG